MAGDSRAGPANDLPDATTSKPQRPAPTWRLVVQSPTVDVAVSDPPASWVIVIVVWGVVETTVMV